MTEPTTEETLTREMAIELIRKRILRQAAEARASAPGLMKFVMHDEQTQERIRSVPPHLSLMFEFVTANPMCAILMPPGFGKTSVLMAYLMWLLGTDPSQRWVYISETAPLAAKFVGDIRTYIEDSHELHLTFPKLTWSGRQQDPWAKGMLTIEREAISKDPSLRGVGLEVGIQGSRLSGIIADDILTQANTVSKEQRDKIWGQHSTIWLHRLDPKNGRLIAINTAWNEDDYIHRLKDPDPNKYGIGIPTLELSVYGDIYVYNAPEWDSDLLRPATTNVRNGAVVSSDGPFRLKGNDAIAQSLGCHPEDVPLWPAKYPPRWIEEKRSKMTPITFSRTYEQKVYSGDTTHCPIEWFGPCKQNALKLHHLAPTSNYEGANPVVMGVDLAVHEGEEFDYTVMSTWEFRMVEDLYLLLDIESVQLQGPQIVERIYNKAIHYRDCHVVVENNGAQHYIAQFLRQKEEAMKKEGKPFRNLNIRTHETGGNGAPRKKTEGMRVGKWNVDFGIESLFVQVMNKKWAIPCDPSGKVHPSVQRLIDGCIYYRPEKHTSDELMSAWFAITWGKRLMQYRKMSEGGGGGSLLGLGTR